MSTDVPGVLKPRLFSNKDLRNLILPLIIEQFLNVTIGIADTVMIASVGEAAVSGISLIDAINILFVQFFAAIATGGAVVVSQYIGRRDHPLASEAARQLIWSSTLLATLIMAILLSAHNSVLFTIYGAVDAQVMSNARIYFIITLASYPFLAVYNAGAALYRSQGNSRVSMNISLVMNFINILFNALLIYVLKWGSAGAGTATLLSRIVGAWIIMTFLLRKNEVLSIGNIVRIKLKWHMIKRILRIGIPSGIENTLFQIGKVLVLSLITSFGTASVAANAIMNLISSFILVPGSAIGLAMITVVGQCMGGTRRQSGCILHKTIDGDCLWDDCLFGYIDVHHHTACGRNLQPQQGSNRFVNQYCKIIVCYDALILAAFLCAPAGFESFGRCPLHHDCVDIEHVVYSNRRKLSVKPAVRHGSYRRMVGNVSRLDCQVGQFRYEIRKREMEAQAGSLTSQYFDIHQLTIPGGIIIGKRCFENISVGSIKTPGRDIQGAG